MYNSEQLPLYKKKITNSIHFFPKNLANFELIFYTLL